MHRWIGSACLPILLTLSATMSSCKSQKTQSVVKDQAAETPDLTALEAAIDNTIYVIDRDPGNEVSLQPSSSQSALNLTDQHANDFPLDDSVPASAEHNTGLPPDHEIFTDEEIDELTKYAGKNKEFENVAIAKELTGSIDTIQKKITELETQSSSLGLTDNSKDVEDAKAEIVRLKASITRLEAFIKTYENKPLYNALSNQPADTRCVSRGGILRDNKCQCRGWGSDVMGFTFDIPTSSAVATRLYNATSAARNSPAAVPLHCPALAKEYCIGDFTKGNACGIFGKDLKDAFGTAAIAVANPLVGEQPNECYLTVDKLIRDNVSKIFRPAPEGAACGEKIAIQRGRVIEIWQYNPVNGEYVQQLSSSNLPKPAANSNDTSTQRRPPTQSGTCGGSITNTTVLMYSNAQRANLFFDCLMASNNGPNSRGIYLSLSRSSDPTSIVLQSSDVSWDTVVAGKDYTAGFTGYAVDNTTQIRSAFDGGTIRFNSVPRYGNSSFGIYFKLSATSTGRTYEGTFTGSLTTGVSNPR